MKKSLLLLAMCLSTLSTYAQDDDVYFVPSSKDRVEQKDTYTANPGRSSYTPITGKEADYSTSHWADGRGYGGRDIDAYNRRGRNYKGDVADSVGMKQVYDQAYEDGYEDGSCTARIVRFWSPRAGIYVSSPFYFDYYDLCGLYDPFYYGYGSPWSWGWSGWYGWGSWYGWRPYYSSFWGWGGPWYDPWYGPGWGGPSWAWRPTHWLPSNAERGPVGGWVSRGGARGAYGSAGYASSGRGASLGLGGRGFGSGSNGTNASRRSFGNVSNGTGRVIGNGGSYSGRGFGTTTPSTNRSNNRTFTPNTKTDTNRSNSRTFDNNRSYSQPSTPSRSNSGSFGGRGFGSGSVGGGRGFGGGSAGGGRGFGGRR